MGDIENVQGLVNSSLKLEAEDTGSLVLKSVKGTIGTIEASWLTPVSEPVIEIYGTKGTGIINYNTGRLKYKLENDDEWQVESNEGNRFTNQAKHFIDCVKNDQEPIVNVDDGLKALQAIETVYSIDL